MHLLRTALPGGSCGSVSCVSTYILFIIPCSPVDVTKPPTYTKSETRAISPISTPRLTWGSSSNNRAADRRCPKCRIELLTSEKPGFCCGRDGNRFSAVQRLPQLPPEFDVFLRSPDISKLSWKLNLIFPHRSLVLAGGPPIKSQTRSRLLRRTAPQHSS